MDQPMLPAAALVCTAWYHRAMRNLYQIVRITNHRSFNILVKQCRTSPRVKKWLASTRTLVADSYKTRHIGDRDPGSSDFLQAVPLALVRMMPGVRVLRIQFAKLRFVHQEFFLALSRFKPVTSLRLYACILSNITQLRRVICALPRLAYLTIHVKLVQRGPSSYARISPFQPPSDIRLRHLDIDVQTDLMMTVLDWMTRSSLCASLEDLTVTLWDQPLRSLNEVLEMAGESLTQYHERCPGRELDSHGNLSHNTALQSWELELDEISPAAGEKALSAWFKVADELHCVLSTVQSRALEHIEIRANVSYYPDGAGEELGVVLEQLDLQGPHGVMSERRFDALKAVKVVKYLHGLQDQSEADVDDIAQKIDVVFRGILRPWSDRGIVSITPLR
ncbi:uncharacterized protein B0H18DRAFT_956502 [Fomitopsis serialis]|uniref:uncharacterized protein n=1 Tax=Fomitopsis serialis TaxID=139415 RepID=UPI00200852BB|nr:uncharacterized protein B0H18DRAFT_956502 [Neoantrodia serialis]KAH9921765.1 hypothetical protein B0H18DRAFT_956502 [Neoantrodia serialis]